MHYSIIQDFINFLNDTFKGQIPNLIYFVIGIILGIIIFIIILIIVLLISKIRTKRLNKIKKKEVKINQEYKTIIEIKKDLFNEVYKDKELNEKLNGIIKITLSLLEEIATLYYPSSNDPMFEISLEQLVDFLSYLTKRIELIIDNLLEGKLKVLNSLTNNNIKNIKLSKVFELIKSNNNDNKKVGLVSKIKKSFGKIGKKYFLKYSNNLINYEFEHLIIDLGEDINKLYSKQELNFTDITRKERKRLSKLRKKSVGDLND